MAWMSRVRRMLLLAAGVWLLLAFFGLEQTQTKLAIQFYPPWTRSSPGELLGWLGFCLLLTPAPNLI